MAKKKSPAKKIGTIRKNPKKVPFKKGRAKKIPAPK